MSTIANGVLGGFSLHENEKDRLNESLGEGGTGREGVGQVNKFLVIFCCCLHCATWHFNGSESDVTYSGMAAAASYKPRKLNSTDLCIKHIVE